MLEPRSKDMRVVVEAEIASAPGNDKGAALLAQIEACRREVARWRSRASTQATAPKWMSGWDD